LKTLAAEERDELSAPEHKVILAELHRKKVIELVGTRGVRQGGWC
jgi:hypothetical protein